MAYLLFAACRRARHVRRSVAPQNKSPTNATKGTLSLQKQHPQVSIPNATMQFPILSCAVIISLACLSSATALTYKLSPNEKACFFSNVEQKGAKIAFYFAVSIYSLCILKKSAYIRFEQVQSGGSFDVDYEVVGPNEKVISDGQKERQGDFVFTAGETGEYRFCFNNEMSTFADKFVDFEIAVSLKPVQVSPS